MSRDSLVAYRRLAVTGIVEKPTVEYARTSLVTPGLPAGEFLSVFGLYIIVRPRTGRTLAPS